MARKKKAPPKERVYTIEEMSKLLQVDTRTLVEWVQYRRIPYVLVNGELVRFKLSDIAKWIKNKNRRKEKFNLS